MGITLFLNEHFSLKIFKDFNFYDYDNLHIENGFLNNDKNGKSITYAYYKLNNFVKLD